MVAFKIIRGFLQIGVEKWAIVAKMPQLTSQPLDADLMVRNGGWQTHPHHQLVFYRSISISNIGVGVEKEPSWL